MKCFIRREPWQHDLSVWLWDEFPGGEAHQVFWSIETQLWERDPKPMPEGEFSPKPSLLLPVQIAEELYKALGGAITVGNATAGHLKDAIGVRDRLLTIVERMHR